MLKVKVKVKGHVIRVLLYWHENRFLRIIGIREIIDYSCQVCNAIYYFLHFNTVGQVAARLRAKSAIYDCLVYRCCFTLPYLRGGRCLLPNAEAVSVRLSAQIAVVVIVALPGL